MNGFRAIFLKEAHDFLSSLSPTARKKVLYNIDRVLQGERNSELFKKLEGTDIWEFRTLFQGIAYRLFAFWDVKQKSFIIVTHGLLKKTQKTPRSEIKRAESIRRLYLEQQK